MNTWTSWTKFDYLETLKAMTFGLEEYFDHEPIYKYGPIIYTRWYPIENQIYFFRNRIKHLCFEHGDLHDYRNYRNEDKILRKQIKKCYHEDD